MYKREEVEFVPLTELTPEVYAKVKVGVRFEDLYKLGLRDEIEFVAGTDDMPDMWYKFNEQTGEFDAYTHYEALIRWGLGLNMPAEAPEDVVPGEPVTTVEELVAAIAEGGEFKLEAPMDLEQAAVVESVTKINLNDQVVTAGLFAESGGTMSEGDTDSYAFWVKKGGELTLDGEGNVEARPAKYSMAVWAQGGKVVINGGKYYNAGEGSDLIYASEAGRVEIYGGEFHACKKLEGTEGTAEMYSALNLKDNSGSEIIVYGGKFYGFDPANNKSENPPVNFVAEGYESIESEENGMKVYTVQKIAE